MTNVIMYKSNDTFSQIDEKDDLLCVEEVNPNIEEALFQYKNNEGIDKRSKGCRTNLKLYDFSEVEIAYLYIFPTRWTSPKSIENNFEEIARL